MAGAFKAPLQHDNPQAPYPSMKPKRIGETVLLVVLAIILILMKAC